MMSNLHIKWMNRMADIDSEAWNALALPLKTPLLEWEWLYHLEASGSISPKNGWSPRHLTVWEKNRLVAAAPLYIKTHSEGEFVFDYAWAQVAVRLDVTYYPKLVGMSPVTPITGYRFLIAAGYDESAMCEYMAREIDRYCLENHLNGCSFLFVDPEWEKQMAVMAYNRWMHQSYIWENRDFGTFDDYLRVFKTGQRRNIRRERQRMIKQGIVLKTYRGDEISPGLVPHMYRFYENTNSQYGPWGCKYLNEDFFSRIYRHYRHRLMVVAAFQETDVNTPLGMALFIVKEDLLLGRYWGSGEWVKDLHFNTCYYEPIQWAIENDIRFFNPGAGSNQKLRRGFRSVESASLHRFYDERLDWVMRVHMDEINRLEREHIDTLNAQLPLANR
jgi:predicted N-acyltransferase